MKKTNTNYINIISSNGIFHITFGINETDKAELDLPVRYAKLFAKMDTSNDKNNNKDTFQFFAEEFFKLSNKDRNKFQAIIECKFADSLLNRIIDLAILVQKLHWFKCIENADNFRNLGIQLAPSSKYPEEIALRFHNKVRGIFNSDGNYYYISREE